MFERAVALRASRRSSSIRTTSSRRRSSRAASSHALVRKRRGARRRSRTDQGESAASVRRQGRRGARAWSAARRRTASARSSRGATDFSVEVITHGQEPIGAIFGDDGRRREVGEAVARRLVVSVARVGRTTSQPRRHPDAWRVSPAETGGRRSGWPPSTRTRSRSSRRSNAQRDRKRQLQVLNYLGRFSEAAERRAARCSSRLQGVPDVLRRCRRRRASRREALGRSRHGSTRSSATTSSTR